MRKRPAASDVRALDELQFSYELRETSRLLLAVLKRCTEPRGITLAQYFLLRHLWDDEGINQSELSERLGTTQPATVATVDSLEKRRLIKRVRSTDDRRMVRLYLTAKGRTMRDTLLGYARELSLQALDGVAPADVAKIRSLLAHVRANLAAELADDATVRGA
ncbi:MAG TPA: MarR family transcriptional regulator [Candidatus Lustribacter sp.]